MTAESLPAGIEHDRLRRADNRFPQDVDGLGFEIENAQDDGSTSGRSPQANTNDGGEAVARLFTPGLRIQVNEKLISVI